MSQIHIKMERNIDSVQLIMEGSRDDFRVSLEGPEEKVSQFLTSSQFFCLPEVRFFETVLKNE